MSTKHLRCGLNCAFLLGLAGMLFSPANVQAQIGPVGASAAANQAVNLDALATLKSAHKLLEEANHDYQGHRAKAVHAIHQAIREIEHHSGKGAVKHTQSAPAKAAVKATVRAAKATTGKVPPVHEAQAASDTQLRAAQQLLLKVQAELSSGTHPKASVHVQTAILELQTALKII
jgi:hypothetical protein